MYLFRKFIMIFSIPTGKYRTLLPSEKNSAKNNSAVRWYENALRKGYWLERTAAEGTDLYG
jgi:hypothetical protein